jgi:hypothetical protein
MRRAESICTLSDTAWAWSSAVASSSPSSQTPSLVPEQDGVTVTAASAELLEPAEMKIG